MGEKYKLLKVLTYGLLLSILAVYALVLARDFLYPLVLSVLLAYLLYPAVKKFEEWGIPRIIANLFTILASMAIFVGLLLLLYKQLSVFLADLPALQDKAFNNLHRLERFIEQRFGIRTEEDSHWLRDQIVSAFTLSGDFISRALMATTGTLTKLGLIPVYTFMLLFYRNKFENFIYRLTPTYTHSKTKHIVHQISQVTKRYMAGVVIVILILCFLNSIGLLLIGVEYAILLGILSALMNFIPYFGTLIGGAIPLFYTFTVQGEPNKAFAVVGFFLLIQFTENNILTPNITGGSVNINPFFTIMSIIVGGMIWGLPGMFVSIPLLGMLKIYFDNNQELSAYSYLLGTEGTEEHALTFKNIKNAFKLNK